MEVAQPYRRGDPQQIRDRRDFLQTSHRSLSGKGNQRCVGVKLRVPIRIGHEFSLILMDASDHGENREAREKRDVAREPVWNEMNESEEPAAMKTACRG